MAFESLSWNVAVTLGMISADDSEALFDMMSPWTDMRLTDLTAANRNSDSRQGLKLGMPIPD